jgi:hypothetical protein
MKLYVCWTTRDTPGPHRHACTRAHDALREAGHDPQVVRTYSFGAVPGFLQTPGRREVKRLTGQAWVPVLVTDDGEVVNDSRRIEEWARKHPASAPAQQA